LKEIVSICNQTISLPGFPVKDLTRIREYLNEFLEVSQRMMQMFQPVSTEASTAIFVDAQLINDPDCVEVQHSI
jgi:hypothetical protein